VIDLFARYLIPAAYAVLPPGMNSLTATAHLLTIGQQESAFRYRRQVGGGPARGVFQFERRGVKGIVTHPDTRDALRAALVALRCEVMIGQTVLIYQALEQNDVLASVVARLNLWWVPAPLPGRDDPEGAWQYYLRSWRPGAPHRGTWDAYYKTAWDIVDGVGEDI